MQLSDKRQQMGGPVCIIHPSDQITMRHIWISSSLFLICRHMAPPTRRHSELRLKKRSDHRTTPLRELPRHTQTNLNFFLPTHSSLTGAFNLQERRKIFLHKMKTLSLFIQNIKIVFSQTQRATWDLCQKFYKYKSNKDRHNTGNKSNKSKLNLFNESN